MLSFKTLVTAAAFSFLAAAYSPFFVKDLNTHQPIGNPAGQTNYYHITFGVSSSNGRAKSSATCQATWGDNSWQDDEAYSLNVPTGKWINCDSSDFRFQLFPYFSIGNFDLAVQQNFTDTAINQKIVANGTIHISNTTSSGFDCDINPLQVTSAGIVIQHAQGDCSMASNIGAYSIQIESAEACTSRKATAIFEVSGSFENGGEEMLLVGSIPELGSWNPSKATVLSVINPQSAGAPAFGGRFEIAEGTKFEYKYIMRQADGSSTWECCENRVHTIPSDSACIEQTLGSDWFRGGGSAV